MYSMSMSTSHSCNSSFLYKGMFIPLTARMAQQHGKLPGQVLKTFRDLPREPLQEIKREPENTFNGLNKAQVLGAVKRYGARPSG